MFSWLLWLLRCGREPALPVLFDELWCEVLGHVTDLLPLVRARQTCKLFCHIIERSHGGLRLPPDVPDPDYLGITYGRDDLCYTHAKRCLRLLWRARLLHAVSKWEYTYEGFKFALSDGVSADMGLHAFRVAYGRDGEAYVIFPNARIKQKWEMTLRELIGQE